VRDPSSEITTNMQHLFWHSTNVLTVISLHLCCGFILIRITYTTKHSDGSHDTF